MAGQIPLDTQYYPSDFNLLTVILDNASAGQNFALLYADRNMVIDSVMLYVGDEGSAAETLKFIKESTIGLPTFAGTGTSTVMIDTITLSVTTAEYPRRHQTGVTTSGNLIGLVFVPGTNVLDKGSTLWLASNSALAGFAVVTIQIRFRSQL